MTTKLLQIDFPTQGPFGQDMTEAFQALAESIATEDGLLWKVWTENAQTKRAGGWYAFANEDALNRYLAMHTERLTSFGIDGIQSQVFDANVPLSMTNHFPLELLKA
ncbi:monooxygenase [Orrella sp. 11846]|uniref:monooxygenase n=1 Tax=Orrella sp. 11846 TaxID=3409913 RepID=UPI003B5AFDAC